VGIRNRGGNKEQSWTQGAEVGTQGAEVHGHQKADAIYEGTLEGTETNVKTRKRGGHKKHSPKRSRGIMNEQRRAQKHGENKEKRWAQGAGVFTKKEQRQHE
jgi:hypothetical protein